MDRGRKETRLVCNHIKSALGTEKGDVDYVKADKDHLDEIKFQFDQEDLAFESSLKSKAGWDEEDGKMPGAQWRQEGEGKLDPGSNLDSGLLAAARRMEGGMH